MKKKVVAAALICSVLGSSHASNNEKFDDYGGSYQSEVQRPVQRLDRFRRYGTKGVPQVESRFSNRNQPSNNYVINDQTGQKIFLDKEGSSGSQHRSFQSAPQATSGYETRNFQPVDHYRSNHDARRVSNDYESSSFEVEQSNNNSKALSKYDFTGSSSEHVDSQQWRSQGNTHGRFAAANSHRQKLNHVNNNESQSWNQRPNRDQDWSNSNKNQTRESSWSNSYSESPSGNNWDQTKSSSRNWNSVEQPSNTSSHGNNQRLDQRRPMRAENYAMDRRSFWPTRAQQTRHVNKADTPKHNITEDLPHADRRIQSRMEAGSAVKNDGRSNFDRRTIQTKGQQLQQNNNSQYQSLRRPRVRVDLTNKQTDRRKRQRRSWLPNPFRGVSRMFSGIFGRR